MYIESGLQRRLLGTVQTDLERSRNSLHSPFETQVNDNGERYSHPPRTMKHVSKPGPSESSSSTTYKARIIGDYVLEQLQDHKANAVNNAVITPLMLAMHGPQGCGMSELVRALIQKELRDHRQRQNDLDGRTSEISFCLQTECTFSGTIPRWQVVR